MLSIIKVRESTNFHSIPWSIPFKLASITGLFIATLEKLIVIEFPIAAKENISTSRSKFYMASIRQKYPKVGHIL